MANDTYSQKHIQKAYDTQLRKFGNDPAYKAKLDEAYNLLSKKTGSTQASTLDDSVNMTANTTAKSTAQATGKAETTAEVHARRQQELNEVFKNYEEPQISTADDAVGAFSKKDAIKDLKDIATSKQRDSFNNICDKLHKGKITPEEAQQQFSRFLEQNPELKAHEGRFQNILDQLSGKTSAATSTADDAANAATSTADDAANAFSKKDAIKDLKDIATSKQRDSFNNICDKLHKGKITPEEAQQQFSRFLEQNPELKAHEGRFQNILDQLSGKTSTGTTVKTSQVKPSSDSGVSLADQAKIREFHNQQSVNDGLVNPEAAKVTAQPSKAPETTALKTEQVKTGAYAEQSSTTTTTAQSTDDFMSAMWKDKAMNEGNVPSSIGKIQNQPKVVETNNQTPKIVESTDPDQIPGQLTFDEIAPSRKTVVTQTDSTAAVSQDSQVPGQMSFRIYGRILPKKTSGTTQSTQTISQETAHKNAADLARKAASSIKECQTKEQFAEFCKAHNFKMTGAVKAMYDNLPAEAALHADAAKSASTTITSIKDCATRQQLIDFCNQRNINTGIKYVQEMLAKLPE